MKSTFKRNFRLFSFTVKIDVEEANLAVVEEDFFRRDALILCLSSSFGGSSVQ